MTLEQIFCKEKRQKNLTKNRENVRKKAKLKFKSVKG